MEDAGAHPGGEGMRYLFFDEIQSHKDWEKHLKPLVDPRPERLREVAARFGVGPEACFQDWTEFFALGRVADAVVIATPDD